MLAAPHMYHPIKQSSIATWCPLTNVGDNASGVIVPVPLVKPLKRPPIHGFFFPPVSGAIFAGGCYRDIVSESAL